MIERMRTRSQLIYWVFLVHGMALPIFRAELLPGAVFNNKLNIKCMSITQALEDF